VIQQNSLAGPPTQFWNPTEMERDMASRTSLTEAPLFAIPPPVRTGPRDSFEGEVTYARSTTEFHGETLLSKQVPIILGFD
jgi:hypothetical protein